MYPNPSVQSGFGWDARLIEKREINGVNGTLKAQEEAVTSIYLSTLKLEHQASRQSIMILQPFSSAPSSYALHKSSGAD
jgi:hypothetical protein